MAETVTTTPVVHRPDWHQNVFAFEDHIKNQLNLKLDTGESVRDPTQRTVCKHWLRGLCKKGDTCEFLHEYNLRRMPECWFYAKYGFCSNGDECLYLHVEPGAKIRECPYYRRGFCKDGPRCPKKHIRRVACPRYLAGFCPYGPDCTMGHPKMSMPSAPSRSNSPLPLHRPIDPAAGGPPLARHGRQNDRDRDRENGMGGGGEGEEAPRRGFRRNLDEVLCFKCGERGHFANMCPNPNRPGNRGGKERGPGGRERPEGWEARPGGLPFAY